MLRSQGLELAAKSGIVTVTTSATGANWVQLPDNTCNQVAIYNTSGTTLRARFCSNDGTPRTGETYLTIPDGVTQPLRGIANAKQVQIQRDDNSNTPATARFYYESV